MITASLKNYRISPRKFRLVADMIRGKNVIEAKNILINVTKMAKSPLGDLLDSAMANAANNFQLDKNSLFVKEIRVDKGYVLKRSMPVSHGSAHPIKKRTSHVSIVLAPIEAPKAKTKAQKTVIKKDKTKKKD